MLANKTNGKKMDTNSSRRDIRCSV